MIKDTYSIEHQSVVIASSNSKASQNKDNFIGCKFRKQIAQLLQELRSIDVHFSRCVKPNENKQADNISDEMILNYLRYLGVLDTIKRRKEFFPVSQTYKEFFHKFGEIEAQSKIVELRLKMKRAVIYIQVILNEFLFKYQ